MYSKVFLARDNREFFQQLDFLNVRLQAFLHRLYIVRFWFFWLFQQFSGGQTTILRFVLENSRLCRNQPCVLLRVLFFAFLQSTFVMIEPVQNRRLKRRFVPFLPARVQVASRCCKRVVPIGFRQSVFLKRFSTVR